MQKNFLCLACFGFLLLLAAQCFALSTIESPPIADRASFVAFAKQCVEKRVPSFVVNFAHGYEGKNEDILYTCNLPHVFSRVLEKNANGTKIYYKVTYYPGMIIADAYLTGNTAHLTTEQLELLRIAETVLAQTKDMTEQQAELFFHDLLCQTVSYYTKKGSKTTPRHATAIGALIDKQANCQGYCDAFYMLCTMFGLTCDMQSGIAGKERHVWNVIKLAGKWYAVDVTWDDNDAKKTQGRNFISHKYFNAPLEIMLATHKWNLEDETHSIQAKLDNQYFYRTESKDPNFGQYFSTEYAGIDYITTALVQHKEKIRVMVKKTDPRYEQISFINFQINRILANARRSFAFYTIMQKQGKYLYISLDVKK